VKNYAARYGLGRQLDEVQKSMEEVLGPITSSSIIDGVLLSVDLVSGTAKEIPHRLGRAYKGLMVVKKTGFSGSITENTPSDSSIYINLTASANASISVWVF